jgi:Tol biopolymer transport system component
MSWSPDGKYLAVADSGTKAALVPGTKIFFIHVESGERRESKIEVPGPYVLAPAFCPDGKYLAFISGPGFLSNDVYVAPVSGGKSRALTSFHAIMNGLAWTADGRQLVFDSNHQGLPTLWRVPLPGGNPEPLSVALDYAIQPHDCGALGNRLAFQRYSVNTNIWNVPLSPSDHGQPTRIVVATRENSDPAFSPDGQRIAFVPVVREVPRSMCAAEMVRALSN